MSRPLPPWISSSTIGWCVVGLVIAACGGLLRPSSPEPSGQVFLRVDGASPKDQRIGDGKSVVFHTLDDTRHDIFSDPHPAHTGCPALNVGPIAPRADSVSGALRTGVCQFHDDQNVGDERFHGTIRVQ
jgi:hypothetical protein